jgi:cystathionine gamma-lyase
LESHPKIEKVYYPGLKSHPQHAICKKQAKGFGHMVSFYVKGDIKATGRVLKALKVLTLAESLGGVESLISMPAIMTHANVAPEVRKTLGIDDNFVRLSVGIETCDDLINDLKQALKCV